MTTMFVKGGEFDDPLVPPWSADGKFGNCIDLDGVDQYVDCQNVPFTNANGWSVSLWFNADSFANAEMLCGKGNHDDGCFFIACITGPFRYKVQILNGVWDIATMATETVVDTWYNLAVTYDATTTTGNLVIYLNGAADGDQDCPNGDMAANSGDFHLGHDPAYSDSQYCFDGKLDEFRVYDTALSAVQIAAIYNSGNGDDPDNPTASGNITAHWKLNESNGSTAADTTGNYDGTVINP